MLSSQFRLAFQNATGVAFAATDTITATMQGQEFSSTGAYTPVTTATQITPSGFGNSLANGAYIYSDTISANTYPAALFTVTATISTATPAGQVNVFYETYDSVLGWVQDAVGGNLMNLVFTAVGTVGPKSVEY